MPIQLAWLPGLLLNTNLLPLNCLLTIRKPKPSPLKLSWQKNLATPGDVLIKKSWLYHSPDNGWQAILENFSSSQYGVPEDTVAVESYDYYHLTWNGSKIDTLSTDSSALVQVYKMMPVNKK